MRLSTIGVFTFGDMCLGSEYLTWPNRWRRVWGRVCQAEEDSKRMELQFATKVLRKRVIGIVVEQFQGFPWGTFGCSTLFNTK